MACEATGTDVSPCNSANDFHTLTPKESISLNPRQSSAIVMNANGDDTIAQAWHTYLATPGLVKLLGRRDGQTHLGEKLQLLEWKVWGVGKSSCRLFPENEAAKMNILAFRAFGSNRTAPIFSVKHAVSTQKARRISERRPTEDATLRVNMWAMPAVARADASFAPSTRQEICPKEPSSPEQSRPMLAPTSFQNLNGEACRKATADYYSSDYAHCEDVRTVVTMAKRTLMMMHEGGWGGRRRRRRRRSWSIKEEAGGRRVKMQAAEHDNEKCSVSPCAVSRGSLWAGTCRVNQMSTQRNMRASWA